MEENSGKAVERSGYTRAQIPNVVLVGATGSGKSTIGHHLARLLGFGYADVDEFIEARAGKKVAEIFEEEGEAGFRLREAAAIESLGRILNHVVIPGAGAVEDEANWANLKRLGPVVWLATPVNEIANRLLMKPDELRRRPLLADAVQIENKDERRQFLMQRIEDILKRRLAIYQKSDRVVVASHCTPEAAAQLVKECLLDAQYAQLPVNCL